jgi:hypothetical protein
MVTDREINQTKQELRFLADRERREKEYQQLQQEKQRLQLEYSQRHMTTFEKGLKSLPQQIKKDVERLHKTATSPSTKKKAKKLWRILGKI